MKNLVSLGILLWVSPLVAQQLRIASLATDEEVKIEFVSNGCFSGYSRLYTISGAKSTLVVAEKRFAVDQERKKAIDLGIHVLGVIALSAQDRSGLDSLFSFYRTRRPDGCTTIDFIAIEYLRAGRVIGREEFTDGSCLTSMIDTFEKMPSVREGFVDAKAWEHLRHAIPLPKLEMRVPKQMPNKAPEPTP